MADDSSKTPFSSEISPALGAGETKIVVDPKILAKAVKKMKGLIRGNGLLEDKVTLREEPSISPLIRMYRFKARTSIQLVLQYGIKTETGRNTTAEIMVNESEFKKAISQIAINARTDVLKRKQIIDFIFGRSDKGFGIENQRTKFHVLNRHFVQHEKCAACANTGRMGCSKCQRTGQTQCSRCYGRRQINCPKCRGSSRIQTAHGMETCSFCRGDGKIRCTLCSGVGQIKCQVCAASGTLGCNICAGTGWLSHLAHIEVYGLVSFDFERTGLPDILVKAIESNPSRCVEKHDIEVAIAAARNIISAMSKKESNFEGNSQKKDSFTEPDDTIWIDYEAMSPFGNIEFKLDDKDIAGYLFGFQARLVDFPFFLDDLTIKGQNLLIGAAKTGRHPRAALEKAAKYKYIKDVISQNVWIKNTRKTKDFVIAKYPTGINPDKVSILVDTIDVLLRRITRVWRITGLILGMTFFAAIIEYFYLEGGRIDLKLNGLPELALLPIDILLFPLGAFLGIYSGALTAKYAESKALKEIVPPEVLRKHLPKAGRTKYWAAGLSAMIMMTVLSIAAIENYPIPDWLHFILLRLHVIGL